MGNVQNAVLIMRAHKFLYMQIERLPKKSKLFL